MYAIFENGSHQYRVQEGDQLTIDRQHAEPGAEITFDKVLLLAGVEGEPTIGTPLIDGAQVVATVNRQFRGKKIVIRKFKRRKGYRRKKGHRQHYTTVKITRIVVPSA